MNDPNYRDEDMDMGHDNEIGFNVLPTDNVLFTDRDYRIDTDRKLVTNEIKQNNNESV
jgi:hypothetical protein